MGGHFCCCLYFSGGLFLQPLPIFDFRPYKVGVNIPEAMETPEDAPKAEYENIFYYKNKNTGEVKKFSGTKLSLAGHGKLGVRKYGVETDTGRIPATNS